MNAKKLLSYAIAVLMGGCIPVMSLYPLYTKESLAFDERLLGVWVADVNDPDGSWEFARLGPTADGMIPDSLKPESAKLYKLNVQDDKKNKGSFVACLVKLGDKSFLDVFPDRFPAGPQDVEKMELMFNAFFFVPAHTFVKVDAIGDQLKMRLTDDEDFGKLIAAEPNAVTWASVEDRPILTATTKDLQAFILKHADDKRLFTNEVVLVRKPR